MVYTYFWLREDGTPYYIGKGKGRRGFVTSNHQICRPKKDDCILIQECENDSDAYFAEQFFIALYGRKDVGTGCLHNRTNGGEGGATRCGRKSSPETREKIRQALLGKKRPYVAERNRQPWMRAAASFPRPKSAEVRAKISASRTGKKYPKLSEALRRNPAPKDSITGRFISGRQTSSLDR
jgi:hypothetical protein